MQKRWQDWVMLILGIWMFFSPWILSYSPDTRAAGNAYVLGILVVVFAIWALSQPRKWEEWINLILGIWLIISPFVLRFSGDHTATTNHVVLGVLIGIDALWVLGQRVPGQPQLRH